MLQNVAIFYHPRRARALEEAEWLGSDLRKRGVTAVVGSGWDDETVSRVCCGRDLLVAFGGDGTIIHVARMAAPLGVPLVGINLGRVGFLAEMTPEVLHEKVEALVEARFRIEHRTMLDVHYHSDGQSQRFLCLNEVAVARGVAPRAIHVETRLDGQSFMTYTADAILVATATGSTAYSLAAGGPILYPDSRDFMITPVAPHLHIGRSIIVSADTVIDLILSSDRPAIVAVDGAEEHALRPHDRVEVRRSEMVASFARFDDRQYFYTAIADRLK